jgi:hypothetical protein
MKIKNLILVALILLLGAASAQAVVVPAKSVINPSTEVVYVPDNSSTPAIRIYQRASSPSPYWTENTSKRIPLEAKSYGLAVWQASRSSYGRMLISVNNGTNSKLRYYQLDYDGFPTGTPKDVDINAPGSSPMGVTILSSGDRAYLADAGTGRVYYFKYDSSSDSWTQASYIVTAYNIYDVALTSPVDTYVFRYSPFPPPGRWVRELATSKYNIFVSVRGSAGKILILNYNYGTSSGEVITSSGEVAGISYPTYLKINGSESRLYAAVNGASGGDIKVYDIVSGASPVLQNVKTVTSIAGKYGWTGFDVTRNENYLFFSQVQNTSENATKLYKVPLPLTGDVTVNDTDNLVTGLAKNIDGLVTNPGYQYLAATYSGDGSLTVVGSTTHNNPPTRPTDLKQYLLDGVTEIPNGGTTHENKIKVRFRVWDPDPGDKVIPTVRWATPPGSLVDGTVTGPAVTSGTTVEMTIPSGTFANAEYGWDVQPMDLSGTLGQVAAYADDSVNIDFIVDYRGPTPPNAFGKVAPPNAGEACCEVRLEWQNNGDPDGDPLTYHVVLSRVDTGATVVDATTSEARYTVAPGTLTVGATYEWNVSATDSRTVVWADGAETNRWTFTYIDGIPDPLNPPRVVSTIPANGATGVPISTPITITFSESMIKASVESALRITPSVTGTLTWRWNPTQTVAIIEHENFDPNRTYTVSVGGTDLTSTPLAPTPTNFSFTTAVDQPPNSFGKIAPPNSGEACCDVRLEWQNNGDPDGTELTYHVLLYPQGSSTALIDATTIESGYTIPMGRLTVGATYEWNVSATDGRNTVWANGAETNRWTFTYIDGIVDPLNPPRILSTDPVDGATDVLRNAPITITFSESMLQESVRTGLNISPAVTGVRILWNPTQTVATIEHDAFAASTAYTVTVGGTDLARTPLAAGTVPNPFSFTTGAGAGTGSRTFDISYLSETQAENWVSVPFTSPTVSGSPINTIGDLMNSLVVFAPQAGDILTLSMYDNATQITTSVMRDYDGSVWNSWDPGVESQPATTGKMYVLTISNSAGRPTFTNSWEVAGTIPAPGSVTFDLSYLSETQAENWISTPNSTGLATRGDIMTSLAGRFTGQAGDIMTLSWYDNATQTPYSVMRDTPDGTTWNPWDPGLEAGATALGDSFKVTLSNSSGRSTFTVTWP